MAVHRIPILHRIKVIRWISNKEKCKNKHTNENPNNNNISVTEITLDKL